VVRLALPILVGLIGLVVVALLASLEPKYVMAFVALLPIAVAMLLTRTSARLQRLLVACLALTIPLNLDTNFWFRPHIGGAPSIAIGASTLCVLALLAVWLYRYRIGEVRPLFVREPTMVWASIIYMAVGILSLWNAAYRELVFLEEIRLAVLLLTMLVVMNLRDDELLRTFVFFLTVATFMQGVLSTAQFVTHSSLGLQIFGGWGKTVALDIGTVTSRATGTTGHPNVLSYYLESTLPLSLALLLVVRGGAARLWYCLAFLATLAGLLATLSRGAWLSVPVSCGLTLWVLYRKRLFSLSSGIGLSFAGVILTVFSYVAFPTIEKRFLHDDYSSSAMRMPMNMAALSIVEQYPVLGVGLNNFAEVFHEYDTTGYSRVLTERTTTAYTVSAKPYKHVAHNLILWVWVEVGTVGLVSFLWVFIAAFRVARRAYREADEWSRAVLVGCVAGMIGHMLHGQVDPGFRISPAVSILFYSMFGLMGAISLRQRSALADSDVEQGHSPLPMRAAGRWMRPPRRA
jgi:O-antigen ligase